MPKISFIFRTDTHVSDSSPASWKGDYPKEIWSNLEQVGLFAKEREVTAVLDGGDYFHVKAASRNSHASMYKTVEIHEKYPCPTFCVEGNHDLAYNNLDSIRKQPLGVLYASGVFQHLREQVFTDGNLQVRVVGVPYQPNRTLEELKSIQKKPGDDFLVAVVHALASENPPAQVEDFFGEPVFRYSDLITQDGPNLWMFGHWHRDQGVVQLNGKTFINQGALSRGALVHENITRTPQVSLIEFEKDMSFELLPLIVAPPEDVFDLERKERVESESRSVDQFVKRLQEDVNLDPSRTIEDNIKDLAFAKEVRDLAFWYLEQAREVG